MSQKLSINELGELVLNVQGQFFPIIGSWENSDGMFWSIGPRSFLD